MHNFNFNAIAIAIVDNIDHEWYYPYEINKAKLGKCINGVKNCELKEQMNKWCKWVDD